MADEPPLSGRVALVTGASRNIGRAIALALANAGASVAINANKDKEGLNETAALIRETGAQALTVLADLRDEAAVVEMVGRTAEELGRLDILVNNAAIRQTKPFEDLTLGAWHEVTSVVLDGAFLCAHAALPHLVASGAGRLINIGGRSAHSGSRHRVPVVSAKSALVGFTKALALELADRKINVNLVVPGRIDTVRGEAAGEKAPGANRPPPVGHFGSPEDVAGMVCLLAGPGGGFITGQTIHVNGGSYLP